MKQLKQLTFTLLLCGLASPILAQIKAFDQTKFKDHIRQFTTARGQAAMKTADHDHPQFSLHYLWNDTNSTWDTTMQRTYTYYPSGLVEEVQESSYESPGYHLHHRESFTHNSEGKRTGRRSFALDGGNWFESQRDTLVYDAQGRLIEETHRYWDTNTSSWHIDWSERDIITYDGNNQMIEMISEHWDGQQAQYVKSEKVIFSWNQSVMDTAWAYDWTGNSWDLRKRIFDIVWHDYDEFIPAAFIMQDLDSTGTFVNEWRMLCTIDQNGSSDCKEMEWNGIAWDSTARFIEGFDAQGNRIVNADYEWMGVGWEKTYEWRYDNTYASGNLVEVVEEEWQPSSGYEYTYKVEYADFFVGDVDPVANAPAQVTAFPNPTRDDIRFELKGLKPGALRLRIFDLRGVLVAEQKLNYSSGMAAPRVDLPAAPGVYLYELSSDGHRATGRILKQ